MLKATLLTLISTLIILTGMMTPHIPPTVSPSLASAQPEEGLNCFSCHSKEEPEKDKGCLSCHEGYEVKNLRKQAMLVDYAQRMYGTGRGYECALCHGGDPSAEEKTEAHGGFFISYSDDGAGGRAPGCSKCHFDDGQGRMVTELPTPKPDFFQNVASLNMLR